MLVISVHYCALLACKCFSLFVCYPCVAPTFSCEWNKEILISEIIMFCFVKTLVWWLFLEDRVLCILQCFRLLTAKNILAVCVLISDEGWASQRCWQESWNFLRCQQSFPALPDELGLFMLVLRTVTKFKVAVTAKTKETCIYSLNSSPTEFKLCSVCVCYYNLCKSF